MRGWIVALATLVSTANASDGFRVDGAHSSIGFKVAHLAISRTTGTFGDFDVQVSLNEEQPAQSSVKATIQSASIDTDSAKRDGHLTSPDFLDAAKFPTIEFVSTQVRRGEGQWVASGDFTLHGVTKSIELPFDLLGPVPGFEGERRLGVDAALTIDRRDYGVSWNKVLDHGGVAVGNEVHISIHLEMISG